MLSIIYIFLSLKFIMWNLKGSSKIIQQKSQKKRLQRHKSNLKKIKSVMKIVPPERPSFVYANYKQQLTRRQQLVEIDRQNGILLKKMIDIKQQKHQSDKLKPQSQWLKSLNVYIVSNVKNKVDEQNKKMCDRLMNTKTHYSTANLYRQSSKLKRISISISENARRVQSAKSLCIRPNSAYSSNSKAHLTRDINRYNSIDPAFTGSNRRPISAPNNRLFQFNTTSNRRQNKNTSDHQIQQFYPIS